jgi:hypothetical protein
MGLNQEIMKELLRPFPATDIEWRVQSEVRQGAAVLVLPYVTNRAIMERLDTVFGPLNWQNKFSSGPGGGILCCISVRNPETGEWVEKWDGAENTKVEAVKGGLSSAMKRCAVQWGIGRFLYSLPFQYADLKDRGQNSHRLRGGGWKYWDNPVLPKNFLN